MKHFILGNILLSTIFLLCSCKDYVEVNPPKDSLTQGTIFLNDEVATSAITGVYSRMALSGYASGAATSITAICGLSADEFNNHGALYLEFYENEITPINSQSTTIYSNLYQHIYTANAILEGLENSNEISSAIKGQIKGEALFIRAFDYFYLINIFGSVPLQLTTDYRVTRREPKAAVSEVYKQIVSDLKEAEGLLSDNYITKEKVRPNISAVQALLARVYLYVQDWGNAEKYSTLVIEKTGYTLVDLDNVFLKNSAEAIWQLFPSVRSTTANTAEGNLFILLSTPTVISLNSSFALNSFESNDKRKVSWVKSYVNSTGTYYYPFKYKIRTSTTSVTEYSMVLRLAEQYLIRSEARAQQDKLSSAVEDLDQIRNRAGLILIASSNPGISKTDLLSAIQKERRIELFSEWGHRWFDLKRTLQATAVLAPLKPKWRETDVLYPIPQGEINNNPNITQNNGY